MAVITKIPSKTKVGKFHLARHRKHCMETYLGAIEKRFLYSELNLLDILQISLDIHSQHSKGMH